MKAYISVSFNNRKSFDDEVTAITTALKDFQIESWVFVDRHVFQNNDEKQMMNQAMSNIDHCDFLIAETSDKAIGIGVEVGYAKAKGKPIIYCRKTLAEHSTTVSGMSDYQIIYSSINDLKSQLANCIGKMLMAHRHRL